MESSHEQSRGGSVINHIEQIYAESSQTITGQRKRLRLSKGFPTSSTFNDLNNHYNYEIDADDSLEDYLIPRKRRQIRPLILNTEVGDWIEIHEFDHNGGLIKPGICVVLTNGTFLRVKVILTERHCNHIVLRGHRLVYTKRLRPILDDGKAGNDRELFQDLQINKKHQTQLLDQSLVDVPIGWVDKPVKINFTNCERADDDGDRVDEYFCRWKLSKYYVDTETERKFVEVAIERLRSAEADANHRIPDETIRFNWRGHTEKGGSDDNNYTAVDGFCCGGGWSRGAQMAGNIKVLRSFDKDPKACSTYNVNFPQTNCLNVDVFNYCQPSQLHEHLKNLASTPEHVDIAHYSTPCQFFSPAHTKQGPNDETNFAASFCLSQLLDKDRPRVMTFENTAGLERRHFDILKAVFGQVTSLNYSLRFSCLHLAEYGLSQDRRRLIMLASCPGEPLPSFPAKTHSRDGDIPGTLPFVPFLETIRDIPFAGFPNHRPSVMKKKAPPDKIRTLAQTLTCSGGAGNVHPDGRLFTLCEVQLLQGFPLHHRFAKELKRTHILSQIGNAFPPLFVKKLLRHVRRQLQRTDGVPETIDGDDFMTSKEIREQEVHQFLTDHENLPEGTRANMVFVEGVDKEEEEEDVSEATNFLQVDDTPQEAWSWITSESNERPSSSDSIPLDSRRSSSSSLTANPRVTPESIREIYDALEDQPNGVMARVNRVWSSWTSEEIQISTRTPRGLEEVHSSTTVNRRRNRLEQDVVYLGADEPIIITDSPPKPSGSSKDDPIEL